MGGGFIGVDIFFVLSGFLITTLLLQESDRTGDISYGDFLVRRGLRLMPAYLLYVVVLTYGIWGWAGSTRSDHGGWTATEYTVALWAYFVNFAPMGGIWNGQEIAIHLWSLAVEQQYYIVWPLVVIALARKQRELLICGVVLTAATLAAFFLVPEGLYKMTMLPTRGFTLVLGSTAAIAANYHREAIARLPWRWVNIFGGTVVLLAFALSATHLWTEQQVRGILLPLMSIAFVAWIVDLWYRPLSPRIAPFMLNSAVQYIGKVSYGIYLYHELVRVGVWYFAKPLMVSWPTSLGYVTRLSVYALLSIAVAAISYELIEKRFLKLRRRFRT